MTHLPTLEPDECCYCGSRGPLVTLDRDGWEVCLRCAAEEVGQVRPHDYARDMLAPRWGCVPCVACDCVTPVRQMERVEECERHAAGLACLGCVVVDGDDAEPVEEPGPLHESEGWV